MAEPRFVVFRCSGCLRVQASPLRYSSRRCPYCGHVNKLREVEVLAYASTAEEAAEAASRIKAADAAGQGGLDGYLKPGSRGSSSRR